MRDILTIRMGGNTPVVAAAIHDGHHLGKDLIRISALDDSVRLREEDPFTGSWTVISDNRIIVHISRFAFDLNRPPEKAVYLTPSDAWGLELWKSRLPEVQVKESGEMYSAVYSRIKKGLSGLVDRFGAVVVYDLHSYNHRRGGPHSDQEDPAQNPEINLGTGTMDRAYWSFLVDRFISDLRKFDFHGRKLDVRENIKFTGGYFSRWVHENFAGSICCLSIDVKKFFMDEWTGRPDHSLIKSLGEAFRFTVPGVLEALSKHCSIQ